MPCITHTSHLLRDNPTGHRAEGKPEHPVTGGDTEPLDASQWPDDRQPVGRHGTEPTPLGDRGFLTEARKTRASGFG